MRTARAHRAAGTKRHAQMTDITRHTHHTPSDPAPRYSADELKRMREDVSALLTVGMKAAASRAVELMQPPAHDEHSALLDRIQQDLAQAKAAFAARGPADARADARFACDALRLSRMCARDKCRKAQSCRGNPEGCYARANVPEEARAWIARMLLAQHMPQHMPWLPLIADHAAKRAAYDCWIAGLEAAAPTPRPSRVARSAPAPCAAGRWRDRAAPSRPRARSR